MNRDAGSARILSELFTGLACTGNVRDRKFFQQLA
jgi:hypothetical protein